MFAFVTKKVVIIVVAALAVVAVGTTLGIVLSGGDDEDTGTQTTSTTTTTTTELPTTDVTPTTTTIPPSTFQFPDNFKFGLATAAYQIEGAWDADGKGESVWDYYIHEHPDWIYDNSSGDDAAKSYEFYKEDVKILKDIGAQFYRFSIAWTRIMPNGDLSSRNQLGIDYYHKLINELIANGIEPMVTMYHWDMPQYLEDLGGFANPMIIKYFEQYAKVLFEEYGSKVKRWITFNEPAVYCTQFNVLKTFGVGDFLCGHHTILAHAKVYHLYKDKYFEEQQGQIGITLNVHHAFPDDPTNSTHVEAAERYLQFNMGIFAHPLLSEQGGYPDMVRESVDTNSNLEGRAWSRLPTFTAEQIEYCKGTSDFLGLNYYSGRYVKPAEDTNSFQRPSKGFDCYVWEWADDSWPLGNSGWLYSIPEGLYQLLKWMDQEYNTEILITENGWSDFGELDDTGRLEYFEGHMKAVARAIQDGVNVTVHAAWSLIDNFEWQMGYEHKFGVYSVDMSDPDRKRSPKKSTQYLKELYDSRTIEL